MTVVGNAVGALSLVLTAALVTLLHTRAGKRLLAAASVLLLGQLIPGLLLGLLHVPLTPSVFATAWLATTCLVVAAIHRSAARRATEGVTPNRGEKVPATRTPIATVALLAFGIACVGICAVVTVAALRAGRLPLLAFSVLDNRGGPLVLEAQTRGWPIDTFAVTAHCASTTVCEPAPPATQLHLRATQVQSLALKVPPGRWRIELRSIDAHVSRYVIVTVRP